MEKTVTRCPTCGRDRPRSSEANRRYWALVHLIAENLKPNGVEYSNDTWHIYLVGKFLGKIDVQLPNGRTVTQPVSTSKLSTSEFNDYMHVVEAWAAEHGVYLSE